MDNYNSSRRVPLRQSLRKSSGRSSEKGEKSSFLIRFNICLTIAAALILFSKINITAANKITEKAVSLISEQPSLSEVKDKAQEVFLQITSGKTSADVFSGSDSDVEQDILDKAEQYKAMEEQLKNR